MRNGNVTLPVLLALENPALAPAIRSLHAYSTETEFQTVASAIAGSDAIDRTGIIANEYAGKALKLIEQLSEHSRSRDLNILARYFIG
ncbi:Heptaprenyl diphosphate synthase component 2 [compost metagenome]